VSRPVFDTPKHQSSRSTMAVHKPLLTVLTHATLAGVLCAAASCAGGATAQAVPAARLAAGPATFASIPMRVAHRGGAGLAPENTLAAFRSGLANGANALELDIHLSADGRLVVMHDPEVDRTTGSTGRIADLDLAQLKALDAAARFRGLSSGRQDIPTLEEVLELIAASGNDSVELQVEIKLQLDGTRYAGIEEALVLALRSFAFVERTTAICFDFPSLATVTRIEPGLRTCALVGKDYFKAAASTPPDQIARSLAALGVDSVGVREQNLDRNLYEALRRAGLGVGAWTVDEPGRMRQLAALGVDFITSNRPDLLRQVYP